MRNCIFAATILLAGTVAAQSPPDSLAIPDRNTSPATIADVLDAQNRQTELLEAIAGKLNEIKADTAEIRIDTEDIQSRMATKADATQIRDKIDSVISILLSDCCTRVTSTTECVPVQTECIPVTSTRTIIQAPPVTPQLPYTIKTARPFNRSSMTIDPTTGQSAIHVKTPFQRIQTSTPSLPTPELPSRPNLPGCLGGRCGTSSGNTAYGYSNEYVPSMVTTPRNDLGRSSASRNRVGIFRRMFGRR